MKTAADRTADCTSLIQSKLAREELPSETAERMWAGYGKGHLCDGCGQPVSETDIEYELEFSLSATQRIVRLHRVCCVVWNIERVAQYSMKAAHADHTAP
jgi:hypothetical protein